MNRLIPYLITQPSDGLRIEQYLRRKGYSHQNLASLKASPGSVLVNARPVPLRSPLSAGNILTICLNETTVSAHVQPVDLPLSIIYEDEDILVLNKAAGMPVHPSEQYPDCSLANGLAYYYALQNKPFVFRCSNRLDRDTSGLLTVSKHSISGSILSTRMAAKGIRRHYLAITEGTAEPPCGTICAPLGRKPGPLIERTIDYEQGEPAVTHYRLLESRNGYSLVSLSLETGRTHQIRIHMKSIGCPLIGDYLYNPGSSLISRQALHACALEFEHPITGKMLSFRSPLPTDMAQVLSALGFSSRWKDIPPEAID